jgi:predicted GNAT family N-acyltransferase
MKRSLRVGCWAELHHPALLVRFNVFVNEQCIPADQEVDTFDPVCLHAVIAFNGQPVATGRLCPDGRVGRMAVLKNYRGQGLGTEILGALVLAAAQRNLPLTYLHGQVQAIRFYEKFGFIAEGPEFEEAGIAHRLMRRKAANTVDPVN